MSNESAFHSKYDLFFVSCGLCCIIDANDYVDLFKAIYDLQFYDRIKHKILLKQIWLIFRWMCVQHVYIHDCTCIIFMCGPLYSLCLSISIL